MERRDKKEVATDRIKAQRKKVKRRRGFSVKS